MCTYVHSFTKHFCVVKLRRFLTAGVAVVNTASFSVKSSLELYLRKLAPPTKLSYLSCTQ